MKKTKLEERFEKAVNAFFENEISSEPTALAVAENHEIAQVSLTENLGQIADKYFTLFKRIFAFLPGVLFLHLLMPGIFTFGFNLWSLFFLISGVFMVWAGLGDLKNKKHLWLPISVMIAGLIFSLPFYVLPTNVLNYYVYAYIGILPLLFIAPILTKNWLDKEE